MKSHVWHIVFQHGEEMVSAYHVVDEEAEEECCLCLDARPHI